uniref:AlNc14C32G2968 protein n=1 Tax=Albugo laibachii Nc14 TaxID=890382 RepID=F0W818_9STRA|nr:AlNc14C32G2968 [Albugo laibachii Nc14]|eukprot:CCA17271.1 AlNc14C32G2968 [Albugo laibachii Nc14]
MCARECIAIEWRAMDEHFHVKSTGKRWDTVISETEGKVRVTCGFLSENGGRIEELRQELREK